MYKLPSDTFISTGYARDLLIDFSRHQMTLIPKELTEFINSLSSRTIFTDDETAALNDLLEKEIVFCFDEDENDFFPKINLDWDFPATISNAVIEINGKNISTLRKVVTELEALNCFYYAFILTEPISDEDVGSLNEILTESSIISFDLVLNYFKSEKLSSVISQLLKTARLKNKIKVFNCYDPVFLSKFQESIILKSGLFNSKCCGCIKEENFNINLRMFTESQHHNTCLNRKVSIDSFGNIKNCLNIEAEFGNINYSSIQEAVSKREFKKLWSIKKDEILVCKDCEFRHVCTDCRAFLEKPGDIYSKPLKCGYDPYTGEWEEWSTNPLKTKAKQYYKI